MLGKLAHFLFWPVIVVCCVVGSALYHLDTALGRQLGARMLNDYVNTQIAGRLEISRFESLRLWNAVARNVRVYDPQGRVVVSASRVRLVIDPIAGLQGYLRFARAHLYNGDVTLIDNTLGSPTFLDAFGAPPNSGPPSEHPLHAFVEDIRLHNVLVHGELLGIKNLRIEHVEAHGRMDIYKVLSIRVWSVRGTVTQPFGFPIQINKLSAAVFTDKRGSQLFAQLQKGDENAKVDLTYAPPPGRDVKDPYDLDVTLGTDHLEAKTLQAFGMVWAEPFVGPIAGYAHFLDSETGTEIEANLSPTHGHAQLKGKLKPHGYSKLAVQGHELHLHEILKHAPEVVVTGKVTIDIPEKESNPTLMSINLQPFTYGPLEVGHTEAKVSWYPDYLNIDQGNMRYHGGELAFNGRVGPGDQLNIKVQGAIPHIESDRQLHAILPDFSGIWAVDVDLAAKSPDDFTVNGRTSFESFNVGIASARNLRVEGSISGFPKRPAVDATISGSALRVVGYVIGDGGIHLSGVPGNYEAHAFFSSGEHRRATFDASIKSKDSTFTAVVPQMQVMSDALVWSGSIEQIELSPSKLFRLKNLQMHRADESLQVDGDWSIKEPDHFSVQLNNMDFSSLKTLYPNLDVPTEGHADATVELNGDLEKTVSIRANGAIRDARWHNLFPLNLSFSTELHDRVLNLDAHADVAGKAKLTTTLQGMLGTSLLPSLKELRDGYYQLNLNGDEIDLTTFLPLITQSTKSIAGQGNFHLTFAGTLAAPAFELTASVPNLEYEHWQPVGINTKLNYQQGIWNATLSTQDAHGSLFDAEASAVLDVQQLLHNTRQAFSSLETLPWRVAVKMPPRMLTTLPLPANKHIPPSLVPARVGGSLSARGGALKTRIDLQGSIDWFGEIDDELCATKSRPRLTLYASLIDDKTTLQVDGLLDNRRVFALSGTAQTPVAKWLAAGKLPSIPAIDAKLALSNASAESIPFVCHYLSGPLQAQLEAKNLFTDAPNATFFVHSEALRARRVEVSVRPGVVGRIFETPPSKFDLQMQLTQSNLEAHSNEDWWNGGTSKIELNLPVSWHNSKFAPTLNPKGEVHGRAIFDRTPLQAPLAWMAGTANVEGLLGGNLELRGTVEKPDSVGRITVQDGRIDLQTVGQRLRDVHAELVLDEDGIVLRDAGARDGGGTLNAEGEFFLKNLRPNAFQLRLQSHHFPVRREGSPVAYFDSKMVLGGKFEGKKLQGTLQVQELNVEVAETSETPQELAPHPEVHFVDQPSTPVQRTKSGRPLEFRIEQTPKFWVRSSKLSKDHFAALASAKMHVVVENNVPYYTGNVQLYQGFFDVLGKRFDVQSGSMNFNGGAELNPEVNLVAVHYLGGGHASDSVTLIVSGSLNDPVIEFTSSIPTQSQAEVIALLLTGRRTRDRGTIGSQQAAGNDASNFLAGVAGGVFASTLRGELGNYAPTFGVETDEARAQTRLQVGFNVDSILPESWRSFITGLYVEGSFVTRRNEQVTESTGQAQRPGFLLEAQLRKGFVSTVTFSPPANWSIDFTWEP